jgi:agmatinase
MLNFGGISSDFSNYEKAKVVILPLPYEKTTSYIQGTKKGPQAIISASYYLELYDEELKKEPYEVGLHTLNEFIPQEESLEGSLEQIHQRFLPLIKTSKLIVTLGGEHSLSLPIVRAFKTRYPNLSVLYLDAHADLRDEYEGEKYSHACVGRRISEISPLVEVGIRSLSKEEADYIEKRKLKVFYNYQIEDKKDPPAARLPARQGRQGWIKEVISDLSQDVYITVDLDIFDTGIMPSVGTPEPGGLSWCEVLELLFQTAQNKNIVGFDIVELVPQKGNVAPDFLAAKLVYKLIGYIT